MKKLLLSALLLGYYFICNGQEFTPMKSPDVTAFVNSNYLPIDESTGKIDLTIPIYTIDFDGMSFPISISYNTGGVKVNAAASRVGLNWTLNGIGVLNKEIQGQEDISAQSHVSDISTSERLYTEYGYLRHLLSFSPSVSAEISQPYRDTKPDLFFAMAPGMNTKFIHKSNGQAFELSNKGTKIESPFMNPPAELHNLFWQFEIKPGFEFKMTPTNGLVYSFKEYGFHHSKVSETIQNTPLLSINTTLEDYEEYFYSGDLVLNIEGGKRDLFPTMHLSSLTNPITKNKIKYLYSDENIVENNRRVQGEITAGNVYKGYYYTKDFTIEKRISKIIFPKGSIDFYYEEDRRDIRGGGILKKIEVRNNQGLLIKGVVFEQDYFNAVENCTENHCYRLRLNAVKFIDKDYLVIPGYRFEYNTTKLPKRFSLDQDFTGYYNGQSNVADNVHYPKTYFKANQGHETYIPFPFSGYTLLYPNYANVNKAPSLVHSLAGSLTKVTYPTGGYTLFDYELHSFKFSNSTVNSGGLRLKSQKIYDIDNTLKRQITYDYNLENGITSGSITRIPNYMKFQDASTLVEGTNQVINSRLELTSGAFVTYSRVKSIELNNGYTVNEYTNAITYPNIKPSTYTTHGSGVTGSPSWFQEHFASGFYPLFYSDYTIKRGKLISSKKYDQSNNLLKEVQNEYDYENYESYDIIENILFNRSNFIYNTGQDTPHVRFQSSLVNDAFNLNKSIEKQYSSSGILTNEKNYIYGTNNSFLKEKQTIINSGEVLKEKYVYPFDPEAVSMPNSAKLNALNLLSPLQTTFYKNTDLISTSSATFNDYGNDQIHPKNIKMAKGTSPLNLKKEFHNYDKRGNLTEYSEEEGTHITVLWGYRYEYKIAEIIGATHAEVLTALNMSSTEELQNLSNDALKVELNSLRSALPNAQVYSYLHSPLVGVVEITNPNGNTNSYSYDSFHRLTFVKDMDGKIVKRNSYHYKLSPTAGNLHEESLQVTIKKSPTDFYAPFQAATVHKTKVAALVKGGKGNYTYEWTLAGSSTVVADTYDFTVSLPCGQNHTFQVKVTDDNNTQITKTVTVHAANCDEPFYVSEILGNSEANNQNNFWVEVPDGGNYESFSYTWTVTGNLPGAGTSIAYDNLFPIESGRLRNATGSPVSITLQVRVTDMESGFFVTRSRSVVIQHEFVISGCFIAGTSITMFDGSLKNIEHIKINDKVLSYNLKTQKIEISNVEAVETPKHKALVRLGFEKNIENTNTLDHPYYVKEKGWASYDPKATKYKYGLEVKKMMLGDTVLLHIKGKNIQEIKLLKEEFIDKAQQTFNLSKVSKNHNFFANGILVHNKSAN